MRVAALFLICLTNLIAAPAALAAPALFADGSIVLPLEVRTPSSVSASRGRSYPTCCCCPTSTAAATRNRASAESPY